MNKSRIKQIVIDLLLVAATVIIFHIGITAALSRDTKGAEINFCELGKKIMLQTAEYKSRCENVRI